VTLHVFADTPDDVMHALMEQRIPWKERSRSLRYGGGLKKSHPVFAFVAGGVSVELVVLPLLTERNPPLSPVTDRPERGAGIEQVKRLLDVDPAPASGAYRSEMGT
jgi:hypothetical protein